LTNSYSTHLKNVTEPHEKGEVPFGGAYMSSPPVEGQTPPMIGSALIVVAASKEEVIERLKNDIYSTGGVWDVDNAQIWPFKTAIRSSLSGAI
jgi:hypothetical protein